MRRFASQLGVSAVLVVLLVWLCFGCAAPRQQPQMASPAPTVELGPVELSPGIPVSRSLGGGAMCTITSAILPDGRLQLGLALETPVGTGDLKNVNRVQFLAIPGLHHTVPFANHVIGITPMIKNESPNDTGVPAYPPEPGRRPF